MMYPKVSIILPTFNAENTIKTTIESLNNLKYENLEILVINDGSTDNTIKIIEKISDSKKTKIINQKNEGVSVARNRGIKAATGKYCFFIDSDDVLEKNSITKLVSMAEKEKLNLVCCNYSEFNSTKLKNKKGDINTSFIASNKKKIAENYDVFFVQSACAKLINLYFLKKYHLIFNEKMKLGEDLTFSLNLLSVVDKIGYVGSATYNIFNVNPTSLSKRYVSDLDKDIELQDKVWNRFLETNPYIKDIYLKRHINFEVYLLSVYFSNLFLFDCRLTSRVKLMKISDMIKSNINWLMSNEKGTPQNKYQEIMCKVIYSNNKYFIFIFFLLKEKLRRLKFYLGRINSIKSKLV